MKYAIRAIKYFFYFIILFAVLLLILAALGMTEGGVQNLFVSGYKSIGQILLMFAAVSAIYPLFGFLKKDCYVEGEYSDIRDGLVKCMEGRHYELEKEDDEKICFRLRSRVNRVSRMLEDRVTFTRQLGGFRVEGLRKDVVRVVQAVEYYFRHPTDEE